MQPPTPAECESALRQWRCPRCGTAVQFVARIRGGVDVACAQRCGFAHSAGHLPEGAHDHTTGTPAALLPLGSLLLVLLWLLSSGAS